MTVEAFFQIAADKGLPFALMLVAIWWLNSQQSKWMNQAQTERVEHIDYMEKSHTAAMEVSNKRHDECEADRADLRKRFYERIEGEVSANRQAIIEQTKAQAAASAAALLASQQHPSSMINNNGPSTT